MKKLNKKGRFFFWWFVISTTLSIIYLIVLTCLSLYIVKQHEQLQEQKDKIVKLRRENDSQTASILRLVTQLEKNGG
jgi:orfc protein|nr:MAG TPA: cell division protein [Caudoviricetes sp.]